MSWNSFGNFMSARSSALAEFGNMVANLVSAKMRKISRNVMNITNKLVIVHY